MQHYSRVRRALGFSTLIALALVVSSLWWAPAALADEGEQIEAAEAWVEAVNRGFEAMAEVRSRYYPPKPGSGAVDWKPQFEEIQAELSPVQIQGLLATGDGTLSALVDTPGGPMTVVFEFGAEDRIVGIGIESGHSMGSPLPPLELPDEPEFRDHAVSEYVEKLVDEDQFSGTVLVGEPSGKIVYEGAFGLASREFGVPNQLSTRFDVGSINKDYTHLGLLMLAKEGKIDLDATVGKYLPEYPQERVRNEVTLQQLIDHRAGVPDYFDDHYSATPMRTLRTISDYLPIWADRPLAGEPGDRESYSNFGYTILGAVIETVSGLSYPEFVQRRIFDPVGMTGSGFFPVDGITPNVAVGYTRMDPNYEQTDQLWKNIYLEPAVGGPWGKSYSPAIDLYHFYQKLFRHQLMAPGEGWFGEAEIDQLGVGLGGGGPGLSSMMRLEGGWMVVALCNLDMPCSEEVAEVLIEAFRKGSEP